MSDIKIEVWDATGNKRQLVEVPWDADVNPLIAVLIDRMNLPRHSPDGQLLSYKFHHQDSGRQLLDTDTLNSANVQDGDILRLQPESNDPVKGEAARWVVENKDLRPLDLVNLLSEEKTPADQRRTIELPPRQPMPRSRTTSPAPPSTGPAKSETGEATTVTYQVPGAPVEKIEVQCPACGVGYRVPATVVGRDVRCTKCNHTFKCPASREPNRQADTKGN